MVTTASRRPQRVFFIVGRGRSGTTLLCRMLARHPNLEVAPEGFFVMNLRRRYGRGELTAARIDAFCSDLVTENRMRTWGLDLEDVARRLRAEPALDFARACELVYESYAFVTRGRADVQLVGDKNPHYGLFTDRLIQIFPQARFVHIVRDPRDNVLSYRDVPFDLQDVSALAYRWRRYNEEILAVAERHPARFHRLRFEDLLAQPERALTTVCEFLGHDFTAEMLDFAGDGAQQGFYGEDSPWFDKLKEPLDGTQARKWERAMGAADILTTEAICGSMMAGFEYATTIPAPDMSLLSSRARLGVLLARGTVEAEKLAFGALPVGARTWLINTYRSRTGRI